MTQLPDLPPHPRLLTVHLSLDATEPMVWRRLALRWDLRLGEVHPIIQLAMGWTDSHLHRFHVGDPWSGQFFVTYEDVAVGEDDGGGPHEDDVRLGQLLREPDDTLGYSYDFGDGWQHTLRLEAVQQLVSDSEATAAACLDGAGACPPEDVGGIPGYEEMAVWVRSGFASDHAPPGHDPDDLEHLRDWLPPGWHPDAFSVEEVNEQLRRLPSGDLTAVVVQLPDELQQLLTGLDVETELGAHQWLAHEGWHRPSRLREADAAAMTQPWRTVLDVVDEGVRLTAAGYLPPAVVRTIFTSLDMDAGWIGKGNREDQTYPVAELREDMQRLGLLRKSRGQLLPTARGRALRDDPAGLLRHILSRLPVEKDDFGRAAALLQLLAMAGDQELGDGYGSPRPEPSGAIPPLAPEDVVCRVLTRAGWRAAAHQPLTPRIVAATTYDTRRIVRQLLEPVEDAAAAAELRGDLARAALRGR